MGAQSTKWSNSARQMIRRRDTSTAESNVMRMAHDVAAGRWAREHACPLAPRACHSRPGAGRAVPTWALVGRQMRTCRWALAAFRVQGTTRMLGAWPSRPGFLLTVLMSAIPAAEGMVAGVRQRRYMPLAMQAATAAGITRRAVFDRFRPGRWELGADVANVSQRRASEFRVLSADGG
jgi:hypothetical protein